MNKCKSRMTKRPLSRYIISAYITDLKLINIEICKSQRNQPSASVCVCVWERERGQWRVTAGPTSMTQLRGFPWDKKLARTRTNGVRVCRSVAVRRAGSRDASPTRNFCDRPCRLSELQFHVLVVVLFISCPKNVQFEDHGWYAHSESSRSIYFVVFTS